MKVPKPNRWSDYKPAKTSEVAELDFIQTPSTLTFELQEGGTQSLEYSFMKERPQMAALFAKVLLAEGGRYVRKTRIAIVCALRLFNQFIECQRPDINHTSEMTYELLQEYAIWLVDIQKRHKPTAVNNYSWVRRLLKAAKSLYPNAFQQDFELPLHIHPNFRIQRQNTRVLSEEVLYRLVVAAERDVDEIRKTYCEGDVPEGLGALIPFMILIAVRTAINADSLYNIRRDCLKAHVIDTNAFHVVWTKGRSKTGIQNQLHYTDQRGKGVVDLIQFLRVYTEPLIAQAREVDRSMLFLYRYYRIRKRWMGVAVARVSTHVNRVLRAFCRDNQLPDIKMVQLRPSAATHYYKKTGGKLRKVQLLLGHAEISTTMRYIGDSFVESLHNKSIRIAQDALVARVTTVIPKEAKQALVDLANELSSKQLEQITDGEYDTGICKCRNPFDSPQPGQQKGRCCTLFLACLTCPNALFFLEDLPRVIALQNYFLAEKENMRPSVWEILYQDKIEIIESDILSAFNEAQLVEAKHLAEEIMDIPLLAAKGVLK